MKSTFKVPGITQISFACAHHLQHACRSLKACKVAEVKDTPPLGQPTFNHRLVCGYINWAGQAWVKVHSPWTITLLKYNLALTHLSGGLLWHTGLPHHGFPRGCLFQKKRQPLALQGFCKLHHDPWMCLPPHWIQLPVGGGMSPFKKDQRASRLSSSEQMVSYTMTELCG